MSTKFYQAEAKDADRKWQDREQNLTQQAMPQVQKVNRIGKREREKQRVRERERERETTQEHV